MALDWIRDIAVEFAKEEGLSPRIALLYSEQSPSVLQAKASDGQVRPLAPFDSVDPEVFAACDHIVAIMGPEPYVAALEAGADIVLGGRSTDTAVLAAAPLWKGAGAGPAWHAGKTAECGGLVHQMVARRRSHDPGRVDAFEAVPLSPENSCDSYTLSAHMLYENSDPFQMLEPGGTLDVRETRYEAIDDRTVRVTGSRFERAPYTMKLEGASGGLSRPSCWSAYGRPTCWPNWAGILTR